MDYTVRLAKQVMQSVRPRRAAGGQTAPLYDAMNEWRKLAGQVYGMHQQHMAAGGMPDPVQSPTLAPIFQKENHQGVIVSPRPGKGSGPTINPEPGFQFDPIAPVDESAEAPWSPATPNLLGAKLPPPVQHPALYEPRMDKLTQATARGRPTAEKYTETTI